jgi:uncharacterized protein YeaO (DUF488 family)
MVRVKRVYESPSEEDGIRILVDRLWPRGFSKARAEVDLWLRDLAPSPALRAWFEHDPAKWDEFRRRYRMELSRRLDELEPIIEASRTDTITLVYSARDEEHNAAVALREYLREHARPRRKAA